MRALLRQTKLVALIAVALIMGGCAATQKLSDEDRARFKSAKISATVEKAPQAFLLAPSGANIGLMFGAIGGVAAAGTIHDAQTAFAAYLDQNSISVETIVREEIEAVLRESGKLAIASAADAAAPVIKIAVPQYGFGVTHLLASKVVPVLWIKCDMVDSSGKLLWSANERMLPSIASPMEPTTWEELRANPKEIEAQWRKASRYLGKKIVDEL
jgi:hypothetical protein